MKRVPPIFVVTSLIALSPLVALAQIDFDRPEVLQTSLTGKMQADENPKTNDDEQNADEKPVEPVQPIAEHSQPLPNYSQPMYSQPLRSSEPNSYFGNGSGGCNSGNGRSTPAHDLWFGYCEEENCGGSCFGNCRGDRRPFFGASANGSSAADRGWCNQQGESYCCESSNSRFGMTISGIIDIPMDGVFHTGDDARLTAGALGVPGGVLAAATPIDILLNEQGFEDVYDTFGGFESNITMQLSCNTSMFVGYRFLRGESDSVNIGSVIVNPDSAPVVAPVTASFGDYKESSLQAGFLTNQYLRSNLDFIWGGRMAIGWVDDIPATLDLPGLVRLRDVRFYDDTTNLNFGFNFGFKLNLGCRLSAHALTGIEYRTSLNGDDRDLAGYGLAELNNGSGFASLPLYLGITYFR